MGFTCTGGFRVRLNMEEAESPARRVAETPFVFKGDIVYGMYKHSLGPHLPPSLRYGAHLRDKAPMRAARDTFGPYWDT